MTDLINQPTESVTSMLEGWRDVYDKAPEGGWIMSPKEVWLPHSEPTDTEPETGWDHGRCLVVEDNDWHEIPGDWPELWDFIAESHEAWPKLLNAITAAMAYGDDLVREKVAEALGASRA